MIHVVGLALGRPSAMAVRFPGHGDQVDQRPARSEVVQTEFIATPVDCATDNIAIELEHPLQVGTTNYDVIDAADLHFSNHFPHAQYQS